MEREVTFEQEFVRRYRLERGIDGRRASFVTAFALAMEEQVRPNIDQLGRAFADYWINDCGFVPMDNFNDSCFYYIPQDLSFAHLAGTLREVEQVLVTGEYDNARHAGFINEVYGTGVFGSALHVQGDDAHRRRVPYRNLREMWRISREDPSLSSIIEGEGVKYITPLVDGSQNGADLMYNSQQVLFVYKAFMKDRLTQGDKETGSRENRFNERQRGFLAGISVVTQAVVEAADPYKKRMGY